MAPEPETTYRVSMKMRNARGKTRMDREVHAYSPAEAMRNAETLYPKREVYLIQIIRHPVPIGTRAEKEEKP